MEQTIIALPQFAPLSVPVVLHMLGLKADEFIARVAQPGERFLHDLRALEQQVVRARNRVLELIEKELQASDGMISINWFCAKAGQSRNPGTGKPISLRTLTNWRKSGALRSPRWGELDLDSAAGALMVLSIDRRERHTFPTTIAPDEPAWWCLSQAPPTRRGTPAPVLPCPAASPPIGLEPGTLLWSPHWPSFSPEWLRFPGIGAIRFLNITKEALGLWDPQLQPLFESGPLAQSSEQAIHSLAQSALYKLAVGRLGVPSSDLAPLWPCSMIWPNEVTG